MSEFYSLNLFSVNTNLIKFYVLLLFCLLILCKTRGNMFQPKKEEIKIEEEPSVPPKILEAASSGKLVLFIGAGGIPYYWMSFLGRSCFKAIRMSAKEGQVLKLHIFFNNKQLLMENVSF